MVIENGSYCHPHTLVRLTKQKYVLQIQLTMTEDWFKRIVLLLTSLTQKRREWIQSNYSFIQTLKSINILHFN